MFFRKITCKSNGKEYTYLKLIESYREGDKVKQRVIANLGSMDKLTPDKVNGLIVGLSKICGVARQSSKIQTKKILSYGEVLALNKIWELLGVDALFDEIAPESGDGEINASLLVELMAINQVIKPQHKQAISEWYRCLYMPPLEGRELVPHHFYRALETVAEHKEDLERKIFSNLSKLLHINTDLAFCRLTTGMLEPAPRDEFNLTPYGKYILGEPEELQKVHYGLLVSRDGMPLGHNILREIAEEWEFQSILDYLKGVFGIDKCIFVGDRSIVDNPSLEILIAQGHDYIIGRKYVIAQDRDLMVREIGSGAKGFKEIEEDLWFKEIRHDGARYLMCYNPKVAEQTTALMKERLDSIENELADIKRQAVEKRGFKIKRFPIFKDSYFQKYFDWHYKDLTSELTYRRKYDLVIQDCELSGAFLLETNNEFLRGSEVVKAYTSLAQISDDLKEIKNFEPWQNLLYAELKISANLFVSVLASMMERIMERIIRQAGLNLNTRQALVLLEDIKVAINQLDDEEFKSITNVTQAQEEVLNALGLVKEQRTVV